MKKVFAVLLALLMFLTFTGCSSKEKQPKPEEGGGFTNTEDKTVTAELQEMFNKAFEGFGGGAYTPTELVATQVVNGINYKFLCDGTKTTYPKTVGTYYVTINQDTQGNVSVVDIEVIEESQEKA